MIFGIQISGNLSGRFFGWAALAGVLVLLAACDMGSRTRPTIMVPGGPDAVRWPAPGQASDIDPTLFLRPPHMAGREPIRVALLLPTGSGRAGVKKVADAMHNAAQLALFEFGNPRVLLLPKDTGGTAAGAELAAQEALQEGAEIILGPLFSDSVAAVAPAARRRGVPVIAFSTDSSVAGDGVYLLSFLPEQDVYRVIDYAVLQGLFVFAGLVPDGGYGRRVENAFVQAVTGHGGEIFGIESYVRDPELMFGPARRLALYDERQEALQEERKRLEALDDEDSLAQLEALEPFETFGDPPYQAVFLPEGGDNLRSLAPLLPYFDVDPRKVRFLGTGLWDDPKLGREPTLVGGWFAAPPPGDHDRFVARFRRTYGDKPPRIASLSYDAVSLAVAFARRPAGNRFDATLLVNPDGFSGVDGLFRFLPDGTNERGLAVMEIRPDGPKVIDPAPTSFAVPPAL